MPNCVRYSSWMMVVQWRRSIDLRPFSHHTYHNKHNHTPKVQQPQVLSTRHQLQAADPHGGGGGDPSCLLSDRACRAQLYVMYVCHVCTCTQYGRTDGRTDGRTRTRTRTTTEPYSKSSYVHYMTCRSTRFCCRRMAGRGDEKVRGRVKL